MLKSKGSLYILFPVVIFIWGAIIYKVVSAFGNDTAIIPETAVEKPMLMKGIEKDTFSLIPVEMDPFLGHYYKKPVRQQSRLERVKKIVTWPELQYLGIVSGGDNATTVYILRLNGKQVLLEKGGAAEGLSILSGSPSKIKLKFQGDSRVIIKAG